MANCIKCGATLPEFDAGGDMVCQNCESRAGAGGGTDVPCQRCGMYLPPHELRMWNSRLYCAYCIMDIQDEERFGKGARAEPQAAGEFGQSRSKRPRSCQRCGREAEELYTVQGMDLCMDCYSSQGGASPGGARPSRFGQVVQKVKRALGISPKPVATMPAKIAPAPPPPQVFSISERKMSEKKPALEEKRPLSEARREERKKPKGKPSEDFYSKK